MNTTLARENIRGRVGRKTDPPATPPAVVTPPAAPPVEVTPAELGTAIAAAVTEGMKGLPAALAAGFAKLDLGSIVTKAISDSGIKASADGKITVTELNIAEIATKAITAAVDSVRADSKVVTAPPGDGAAGGRSQIEVPFSLCKGNLPPHMKELSNLLLGKKGTEGFDQKTLDSMRREDDRMWQGIAMNGAKALTAGTAGEGAEFVPRSLSSEVYRRLYLASQLAQAYMAKEVQMPTDPYDYPLITTNPVFKLNNVENRDAAATQPGTSNFTLTTKTLMALVQFSYKADEDSIVPLLPTLQGLLADAGARALENAIINGDTTSSHQDSDVTDVEDQAKAWKGFRKLALAVSALKADLSSGALSRTNLNSLLKLLGKWGVRSQDLLWIVGPRGWTSLLNLDEVALAYARGGAGTYTQGGPPPAPWGGQIVVSEMVKENVNASGVYDGSTTTKGTILVVRRDAFVLGSRRELLIEVARNIRSQTNDIVASFRKAFQPVETPSATVTSVACGYNYTS